MIDVAAGVILKDGRYLITQRLETSSLGGLWEFPGGKRHPGESIQDCLSRELKEELGVTVRVGKVLKIIQHDYGDCTIRLYFHRCTILNGTPQPLGNQACRWVAPADLSRFSFPEANEPLIRELQNYS